jgi:HlyD family secretion protein
MAEEIMESARKIVNIVDAKPLAKKGGWKKAAAAIGVVAVAAALAVLGFSFLGRKERPLVKSYDTATVQAVDLSSASDASGTVVVPVQITVSSPQQGYADALLVAEGDSVAKGQILARLSVPDLEQEREDLKASIAVARLGADDARVDYDYQIQTLETSIARLDGQIAEAEAEAATEKALAALKSSRQSDYEAAVSALETLREKREDAAAQLELQKKKKDVGLRKQAATIAQLEVALERVVESIAAASIKSPISGEVLSVNSKLSVSGSLIDKYAELMTVADRAETYIDLSVPEQYASSLTVGGILTATVGTTTLTAKIAQVGKTASLASDGLTAMVTVRVKPESGGALTPGAAAVASIPLGTKQGALTLPRGAYLTTGSQKWVYRIEGSTAVKTAVEFGEMQGNKVEIKKGLAEGDRIISSGYQEFIDYDAVELK